jgi:hypothetical protein
MKIIVPMSATEFAAHLLNIVATQKHTVEFALDCDAESMEEATPSDCETWMYAKYMEVEGYDSRFILIDHCGGEDAHVIPLGNFMNDYTHSPDDLRITECKVCDFFRDYFIPLSSGRVYVEMEEPI